MERDILKKNAKDLFQERSVRYAFIQKYKDAYPIEKMCNILRVSLSSYYYWLTKKPSERLIRRLELGVSIKKVYVCSGTSRLVGDKLIFHSEEEYNMLAPNSRIP